MTDGPLLLPWLTPQTVQWVLHLAMALSALELLWRVAACGRRGHWHAAWGHAWHLGAGLCLMAALLAALTGRDPLWLLLWLSASGVAHLADVWWARRAASR